MHQIAQLNAARKQQERSRAKVAKANARASSSRVSVSSLNDARKASERKVSRKNRTSRAGSVKDSRASTRAPSISQAPVAKSTPISHPILTPQSSSKKTTPSTTASNTAANTAANTRVNTPRKERVIAPTAVSQLNAQRKAQVKQQAAKEHAPQATRQTSTHRRRGHTSAVKQFHHDSTSGLAATRKAQDAARNAAAHKAMAANKHHQSTSELNAKRKLLDRQKSAREHEAAKGYHHDNPNETNAKRKAADRRENDKIRMERAFTNMHDDPMALAAKRASADKKALAKLRGASHIKHDSPEALTARRRQQDREQAAALRAKRKGEQHHMSPGELSAMRKKQDKESALAAKAANKKSYESPDQLNQRRRTMDRQRSREEHAKVSKMKGHDDPLALALKAKKFHRAEMEAEKASHKYEVHTNVNVGRRMHEKRARRDRAHVVALRKTTPPPTYPSDVSKERKLQAKQEAMEVRRNRVMNGPDVREIQRINKIQQKAMEVRAPHGFRPAGTAPAPMRRVTSPTFNASSGGGMAAQYRERASSRSRDRSSSSGSSNRLSANSLAQLDAQQPRRRSSRERQVPDDVMSLTSVASDASDRIIISPKKVTINTFNRDYGFEVENPTTIAARESLVPHVTPTDNDLLERTLLINVRPFGFTLNWDTNTQTGMPSARVAELDDLISIVIAPHRESEVPISEIIPVGAKIIRLGGRGRLKEAQMRQYLNRAKLPINVTFQFLRADVPHDSVERFKEDTSIFDDAIAHEWMDHSNGNADLAIEHYQVAEEWMDETECDENNKARLFLDAADWVMENAIENYNDRAQLEEGIHMEFFEPQAEKWRPAIIQKIDDHDIELSYKDTLDESKMVSIPVDCLTIRMCPIDKIKKFQMVDAFSKNSWEWQPAIVNKLLRSGNAQVLLLDTEELVITSRGRLRLSGDPRNDDTAIPASVAGDEEKDSDSL